MAKADVVAAAVAAVQQGETQVLTDQFGSVFDQAEAQGNGTGFTQADIDAAVSAAQAVDATALNAAQAAAALQLSTLQASLDALTAKEAPEAQLIASLQSSAASLTAALAAINAALNPPVPVPVPVPAPVPAS